MDFFARVNIVIQAVLDQYFRPVRLAQSRTNGRRSRHAGRHRTRMPRIRGASHSLYPKPVAHPRQHIGSVHHDICPCAGRPRRSIPRYHHRRGGIGAAALADHDGSNDYRIIPAPAAIGTIKGSGFVLAGNQLSLDLAKNTPGPVWDVQAGPIARLNFNRRTLGSIDDRRVCALGKLGVAVDTWDQGRIRGVRASKNDTTGDSPCQWQMEAVGCVQPPRTDRSLGLSRYRSAVNMPAIPLEQPRHEGIQPTHGPQAFETWSL